MKVDCGHSDSMHTLAHLTGLWVQG